MLRRGSGSWRRNGSVCMANRRVIESLAPSVEKRERQKEQDKWRLKRIFV